MSAHDFNYVLIAEKDNSICYYYTRTATAVRTEAGWLQKSYWECRILDINTSTFEHRLSLLLIQAPIFFSDIDLTH